MHLSLSLSDADDEILGFWKVEDEIRVLEFVFGTYMEGEEKSKKGIGSCVWEERVGNGGL